MLHMHELTEPAPPQHSGVFPLPHVGQLLLLTQFSRGHLASEKMRSKLKRHTARQFGRSYQSRVVAADSFVDLEGLRLS